MKVLLVATVQSHICQFHRPLVAMLHKHNCEVHVVARDNLAEKNGLKLNFVEKIFDVPFQRSPFSLGNVGAYRILKQIIDTEEYDIIHCNTPVGGVLGRLVARFARKNGTRVFYTAHGFHFYEGAPLLNWLIWYPIEKYMCHYTDTLLTISQEDFELAQRRFPVKVFRIHGVGADSKRFHPIGDEYRATLRKQLGYSALDKLVLCTGELNSNKNQITALRTIKIVAREFPEVRLLLAGNGSLLNMLRNATRSLGIENQVDFLGYRTDLERFVQIADVVLSCSIREGLGLNIIEGMLCAKPVVGACNRGHRELIQDGENGFLVPAHDPELFAKRIGSLLSDSRLCTRLGYAGQKRASGYTDISVYTELEQVYF